jgi:osmotically-inducible protein OsmY
MKRSSLILCALLAAAPAAAQQPPSQQPVQSPADAALATRVHDAIWSGVTPKSMYVIAVDAKDGVVTLKGLVDSSATRERAARAAKNVRGVSQVRDELRVRGG